MSNPKYVCVDLDGTIAHYKGWEGEKVFGEPIRGVQAALGKVRQAGWKIIIYTTRGNQKLVGDYLKSHAIPFDYINKNPDQPRNAWNGKPYADVYVDDRGIPFDGDWSATAERVLKFVPWEQRDPADAPDDRLKAAIDFLAQDYDRVFEQMRKYDDQILDLTKTSFAQLVAVIGAVWVIYSFAFKDSPSEFYQNLWTLPSGILLIISFLFSLVVIQLILRNRVYFAAAARYINDHRDFYLSTKPLGFANRSGYYTDFTLPQPFNRSSSQYLFVVIITLASSFLLGLGAGLLAAYFGVIPNIAIGLGILSWIIVCVATTIYVEIYLRQARAGYKSKP